MGAFTDGSQQEETVWDQGWTTLGRMERVGGDLTVEEGLRTGKEWVYTDWRVKSWWERRLKMERSSGMV